METDTPRFMLAFGRLIGSSDLRYWPAPADVLKNLPKRKVVALEHQRKHSAEESLSSIDPETQKKIDRLMGRAGFSPGRSEHNEKARATAHARERGK